MICIGSQICRLAKRCAPPVVVQGGGATGVLLVCSSAASSKLFETIRGKHSTVVCDPRVFRPTALSVFYEHSMLMTTNLSSMGGAWLSCNLWFALDACCVFLGRVCLRNGGHFS